MRFIPFGKLVLIEKLDSNEASKSGIVISDLQQNRFWKVRIIEAGSEASMVAQGNICLANPIPEIDNEKVFANKNYRLIHADHILGRWEE